MPPKKKGGSNPKCSGKKNKQQQLSLCAQRKAAKLAAAEGATAITESSFSQEVRGNTTYSTHTSVILLEHKIDVCDQATQVDPPKMVNVGTQPSAAGISRASSTQTDGAPPSLQVQRPKCFDQATQMAPPSNRNLWQK